MAELWEEYDPGDIPEDIIRLPRRWISPEWWRSFVARFRLANRRWPTSIEVETAWEAERGAS